MPPREHREMYGSLVESLERYGHVLVVYQQLGVRGRYLLGRHELKLRRGYDSRVAGKGKQVSETLARIDVGHQRLGTIGRLCNSVGAAAGSRSSTVSTRK